MTNLKNTEKEGMKAKYNGMKENPLIIKTDTNIYN